MAFALTQVTPFKLIILFSSCRLKKAGLRPPVSCSTPSGPVMSLQSPSVKERAVRRRKEKQDAEQLIIVC